MTKTWQTALKWLGAVAAAALLAGASITGAGAHEGKHKIDAKGDKCVRDADFMRRNHMELLKHQRDDTMRRGIRTTQNSLKGCIDCHASPVNNSVIGTNDNFCQGCHAKVAVKLDCFECHSSKPRATTAGGEPAQMQAKAATSGEGNK